MKAQASELAELIDLFPIYFEKQSVCVQLSDQEIAYSFTIHEPNFAKLASKNFIDTALQNFIKIPIHEELSILTKDHQLEISIPMLGMVDLLKNDTLQSKMLLFSPPVAINGFVDSDKENQPSYPDFMLATDIMGNQYEILINTDGKITLPREGIGRFSMLSHLTFIYSECQIKKGIGLAKANQENIESGYLYLIPPSIVSSFTPKISVTHLDQNNRRIVDSIRFVNVMVNGKNDGVDIEVLLDRDRKDDCKIDMFLSIKNDVLPTALRFSFSSQENLHLTFDKSKATVNKNNWCSSTETNKFIRYFSISDAAKFALVRDIYSEADFMKDCLSGDQFGISHKRHYNDFLLFPEAIGKVYDLIVEGIVHHGFDPQFLWDRISDNTLLNINFTNIFISQEDSDFLNNAISVQNGDSIKWIKSCFHTASKEGYQEKVSFYTHEPLIMIPSISVDSLKTYSTYREYLDRFEDINYKEGANSFFESVSLSNIKSHDSSLFYSTSENIVTDLKLHFKDMHEATTTHDLPAQTSDLQNLSNAAGSFYGYKMIKNTKLLSVMQKDEWGFGYHIE